MKIQRATTILVVLLMMAAAAHGQGAGKAYRVGMLWSSAPGDSTGGPRLDAFRRALQEDGYAEGRNLTLEHRYAEGQLERFPALATDLVRRNVDVIVAASPLAIRAARDATSTIPIVMINGDPAMFISLSRPGGNITGLTAWQAELAGKQLELLKEALPRLGRVAVLRNPTQPVHALKLQEVESVARALKITVHVTEARAPDDFDGAFASMVRERADGLVVFADGMYYTNRARLASLALRHALPTAFGSEGAAQSGGLVAYVPDAGETYRRAASYVARILKGANAGDLAIEQPKRFQLSVNLKTARALGLTLPPSLLVRADHVVE
jgi:putative ABC transport system substrate-binding protein